MPWRTRQAFPAPNIAIVGGGVASLVAGITLREKLPTAAITLYCAARETMLGGQLASWDEQGYPIEHGLHALFGFYDHILPLLKKIGAYENLTRSEEHIFVRERGALHRFDLRTWLTTYRGFTAAEKMRLLAAAPVLCKLLFDVRRKGLGVFDAYDRYDLRAFASKHGVPESVLHSGFFRQFYEAAFNAPSELSAAVALESVYKIFSKKWHYYFNSPTRQSIIAPLQRHFTDGCGGRIEFHQKLIKVRTDAAGVRVLGLDFQNQATGDCFSVEGGRVRSGERRPAPAHPGQIGKPRSGHGVGTTRPSLAGRGVGKRSGLPSDADGWRRCRATRELGRDGGVFFHHGIGAGR